MIILTSLCGADGNALKHDGIQRENMNASLAAIINTAPSAENLKLKAGMPSQESPLIYSRARVRFITAAVGNISPDQIIPLFSFAHRSFITFFLSSFFILDSGCGSPLISSFFVLFLLAISFVCAPPPPHGFFVHVCSL